MTCSIEGCDYPVLCRGWCNAHYLRWQKFGDPTLGGKPRPRRPKTIREMFEFYMPGDPPPEGVIWRWTGQTNQWGYGRMSFKRRKLVAARVSYELFVGPIPDGMWVGHKNNKPIDINPHNLELRTIGESHAVMTASGRRATAEQTRNPGIDNGSGKLTDHQIRMIRFRRNEQGEPLSSIAADYGVTKSLVSQIALGKWWTHVGG